MINKIKYTSNENRVNVFYEDGSVKFCKTDSELVQEYIANGGVVEPTYTEEEELSKQKLDKELAEAEAQRKQAMLDGANYNGYQVSLTAEDGNGMIQVKSGFDLGLTSTTIHFENGTKMPITAEEFPTFALWFVNERNKFFV